MYGKCFTHRVCVADRLAGQLSGGMKRRLSVARSTVRSYEGTLYMLSSLSCSHFLLYACISIYLSVCVSVRTGR